MGQLTGRRYGYACVVPGDLGSGCVQFSDQAFGAPVTITVAGGYHVTLNYGESTTGKSSYSATDPGSHAVTADMGGSGQGARVLGVRVLREDACSSPNTIAP